MVGGESKDRGDQPQCRCEEEEHHGGDGISSKVRRLEQVTITDESERVCRLGRRDGERCGM